MTLGRDLRQCLSYRPQTRRASALRNGTQPQT